MIPLFIMVCVALVTGLIVLCAVAVREDRDHE